MMMTQWFGGFFDADGSVWVYGTTTRNRNNRPYLSYRPRFSVHNTHEPTIQKCAEVMEQWGPVQITTRLGDERSRPVHSAMLVSWESVGAACEAMVPLLVTKHERATLVAEWCADRLKRFETTGRFRTGFNEDDHIWYQQLLDLNKRGV